MIKKFDSRKTLNMVIARIKKNAKNITSINCSTSIDDKNFWSGKDYLAIDEIITINFTRYTKLKRYKK